MESKRFTLRPPLEGDMAWVVAREGAVYSQEFGFDASFEALVARIVNHFAAHFNPARERCWIAEVNGAGVCRIYQKAGFHLIAEASYQLRPAPHRSDLAVESRLN